jgi:hypothetical protein
MPPVLASGASLYTQCSNAAVSATSTMSDMYAQADAHLYAIKHTQLSLLANVKQSH